MEMTIGKSLYPAWYTVEWTSHRNIDKSKDRSPLFDLNECACLEFEDNGPDIMRTVDEQAVIKAGGSVVYDSVAVRGNQQHDRKGALSALHGVSESIQHEQIIKSPQRIDQEVIGVDIGGWRVTTQHGPIASDSTCERVRSSLDARNIPEQMYSSNVLALEHHASGTKLSFSAMGALEQWKQDKQPPVQLRISEAWRRAREDDIKNVKQVEYDWTFSTSYAGDTEGTQQAWRNSGRQLDRALLLQRDEILLYDEIPLYISELDDNGVSEVSVKVRVMPKCWYILLRFFLRVDGQLVRVRETRLFCRFNGEESHVVLREKRDQQVEIEPGQDAASSAYQDADTASMALQALAPVGVTLYQVEELSLLE